MERARQERTSPVNVQPSQTLTGLPTEYGMSENPVGRDPHVFPRFLRHRESRGRTVVASLRRRPPPLSHPGLRSALGSEEAFFWPQYTHVVQHILVWIRWIACQGDQWYPELYNSCIAFSLVAVARVVSIGPPPRPRSEFELVARATNERTGNETSHNNVPPRAQRNRRTSGCRPH